MPEGRGKTNSKFTQLALAPILGEDSSGRSG